MTLETKFAASAAAALFLAAALATCLPSPAERRNSAVVRSAAFAALLEAMRPPVTTVLVRNGRIVRGCATIAECVARSEAGDEVHVIPEPWAAPAEDGGAR